MPDLLHEYWENADGDGEFGPVREHNDQRRDRIAPGAKLVFSLMAPSWHHAMRLYHERLGYGEYLPTEGVLDHVYTAAEAAEQNAYLQVRERR